MFLSDVISVVVPIFFYQFTLSLIHALLKNIFIAIVLKKILIYNVFKNNDY